MGGRTSKKRLGQIIQYCLEHGDNETCEVFGITQTSLARYKREHKERNGVDFKVTETLKKIQESYTPEELKAISKGAQITNMVYRTHRVDFDGDCITFGHITDLHVGSIYFVEKYFYQALEECHKEKCKFIAVTGDITEGMNIRHCNIYELTHLGATAQKEYAVNLLKQWTKPLYLIDGNHDRWYMKPGGLIIVKEICKEIPNAEFLGQDEGDIKIGENIIVKLWHGEDSSSYATSYRIQKIVEAFSGGEKPNILLAGHTHKQIYMFERNVHCISGGAMCKQSHWMRSKRLANHMGFWIIKAWIGKTGVTKFSPTWYPFYA